MDSPSEPRQNARPRLPLSPLPSGESRTVAFGTDKRYLVTENGCWAWMGPVSPDGYGRVTVVVDGRKKTSTNAHRALYELTIGPIPAGLQLDHLCHEPICVNPAHMEPVTNAENARRKRPKAFCPSGHPMTVENTMLRDYRRCRACCRERDRLYKLRWRATPEGKAKVSIANKKQRARRLGLR